MNRLVAALAATVLSGTVAAGGCGIGPGDASEGEANLTRHPRLRRRADRSTATLNDPTRRTPSSASSTRRRTSRPPTAATSSIRSTASPAAPSTAAAEDWFFFVNGIYSDIGAGEAKVHAGDRIWWDYRDWAEAYRVPAVVGSWPEPFLARTSRASTRHGASSASPTDAAMRRCRLPRLSRRRRRLRRATTVAKPDDAPRRPSRARRRPGIGVRDDPAAAQIENGPGTSGVYARIAACDSAKRLRAFDRSAPTASRGQQLADAGLVAAVRENEDQPTWVVTATSPDALARRHRLCSASMDSADRYAVATDAGKRAPDPCR